MNYVVVVLEPVPQDLGVVARAVSERFKISLDKALALLHRAPGAVTKAVPEQQARTVAEILSEAGLLVEVREGSAEGQPLPLFAAAAAGSVLSTAGGTQPTPDTDAEIERGRDYDTGVDRAAQESRDTYGGQSAAREEHYRPVGTVTVTADASRDEQQVGEYAVTDSYDDDVVTSSGVGVGSVTTTAAGTHREVPEAGHATTTPPRDPMKTTLTREPPDLERSGLRRRISTAATLPALLTLVVTLLALAVTLLPVLRQQQERRAEDSAIAVAATLQGLSGGLPLSAPMIRAELRQVEERTRAQLAGRGIAFMTVLDADDTPLLAWDTESTTTGSLSPANSAATRAALAEGGGPDDTRDDLLGSLRESFGTLKAMVGLGSEQPITAAAAVLRNGQSAGSVVVGVAPDTLRDQLGRVLLTTFLVGLIPVLFAVLAALSLTRGLTDAIRYLLVAADRISHGDFERPVELDRDDELGQIGRAIERMRVSLHESMERLRRRR